LDCAWAGGHLLSFWDLPADYEMSSCELIAHYGFTPEQHIVTTSDGVLPHAAVQMGSPHTPLAHLHRLA
jgi:hypothetical protein